MTLKEMYMTCWNLEPGTVCFVFTSMENLVQNNTLHLDRYENLPEEVKERTVRGFMFHANNSATIIIK